MAHSQSRERPYLEPVRTPQPEDELQCHHPAASTSRRPSADPVPVSRAWTTRISRPQVVENRPASLQSVDVVTPPRLVEHLQPAQLVVEPAYLLQLLDDVRWSTVTEVPVEVCDVDEQDPLLTHLLDRHPPIVWEHTAFLRRDPVVVVQVQRLQSDLLRDEQVRRVVRPFHVAVQEVVALESAAPQSTEELVVDAPVSRVLTQFRSPGDGREGGRGEGRNGR